MELFGIWGGLGMVLARENASPGSGSLLGQPGPAWVLPPPYSLLYSPSLTFNHSARPLCSVMCRNWRHLTPKGTDTGWFIPTSPWARGVIWCLLVELGVKEWKGEGSTSPTWACQSGGVWGGGQCKEPGGAMQGEVSHWAWSDSEHGIETLFCSCCGVGFTSSSPSVCLQFWSFWSWLSLCVYLFPHSCLILCYKDKWNLTHSWHLVRNFLFLNKWRGKTILKLPTLNRDAMLLRGHLPFPKSPPAAGFFFCMRCRLYKHIPFAPTSFD